MRTSILHSLVLIAIAMVAVACGGPATPPPDVTPPTCTGSQTLVAGKCVDPTPTAPTNTVSSTGSTDSTGAAYGTQTFTIATDNAANTVKITVDGTLIPGLSPTIRTFTWDTTQVDDMQHELKIVVTNSAGRCDRN